MTELDETVCPVCGKKLVDWTRWAKPHTEAMYLSSARAARWAVAHYLAHLVEIQAGPIPAMTDDGEIIGYVPRSPTYMTKP